MFAESFVDYLVRSANALAQLARLADIPSLTEVADAYSKQFEDARDLRDSTQHGDERAIGVARKKPITPAPFQTSVVTASSGVFYQGFDGNRLCATAADGRLVCLEECES